MQVTIMMVVAALKASLLDKSQCHRDASLPVQAITAGKPMVFGKKNIAAHLPASHKARSGLRGLAEYGRPAKPSVGLG